MDFDTVLIAGGIFALRVVGNMMTTIRMVMIVRGMKLATSIFAMIEALLFAIALGSVVSNLNDLPNLIAYCSGFAVGGYLGLSLEQRLIQRFVAIQIISPDKAHQIAVAIREAGYGATETWGQGAEGQVGTVTTVVGHQQVKHVVKVMKQIDPDALTMLEELRSVSRGYIRLARHER